MTSAALAIDLPQLEAAAHARGLRLVPLTIEVGALSIDPVERVVMRSGKRIALMPREFALLLHLARAGRCVSRAELLAAVWRLDFDPGTNVVEVHISRLRARIDRGFPAPMLRTERGRGYRLTASA